MTEEVPMTIYAKARLVTRIWLLFFYVHYGLRRSSLPDFVSRLDGRSTKTGSGKPPERLGSIVFRTLNVAWIHPRCLIMCLVYFALLKDEGLSPQLVIGLPDRPTDEEAHSWVELDSRVVGPPPGSLGHAEFVRYP